MLAEPLLEQAQDLNESRHVYRSRLLLEQLERHWLANREQHAQFALLTDWADADNATLHTDASVLPRSIEFIPMRQMLNRNWSR